MLIVKQYIYRTRCLSQKLNENEIIDFLEELYYLEKYTATVNEKLRYHNKKWSPIYSYEEENFVREYLNQIS